MQQNLNEVLNCGSTNSDRKRINIKSSRYKYLKNMQREGMRAARERVHELEIKWKLNNRIALVRDTKIYYVIDEKHEVTMALNFLRSILGRVAHKLRKGNDTEARNLYEIAKWIGNYYCSFQKNDGSDDGIALNSRINYQKKPELGVLMPRTGPKGEVSQPYPVLLNPVNPERNDFNALTTVVEILNNSDSNFNKIIHLASTIRGGGAYKAKRVAFVFLACCKILSSPAVMAAAVLGVMNDFDMDADLDWLKWVLFAFSGLANLITCIATRFQSIAKRPEKLLEIKLADKLIKLVGLDEADEAVKEACFKKLFKIFVKVVCICFATAFAAITVSSSWMSFLQTIFGNFECKSMNSTIPSGLPFVHFNPFDNKTFTCLQEQASSPWYWLTMISILPVGAGAAASNIYFKGLEAEKLVDKCLKTLKDQLANGTCVKNTFLLLAIFIFAVCSAINYISLFINHANTSSFFAELDSNSTDFLVFADTITYTLYGSGALLYFLTVTPKVANYLGKTTRDGCGSFTRRLVPHKTKCGMLCTKELPFSFFLYTRLLAVAMVSDLFCATLAGFSFYFVFGNVSPALRIFLLTVVNFSSIIGNYSFAVIPRTRQSEQKAMKKRLSNALQEEINKEVKSVIVSLPPSLFKGPDKLLQVEYQNSPGSTGTNSPRITSSLKDKSL